MSRHERFPFAPIEHAARYGNPPHTNDSCPYCSHLGGASAWGARTSAVCVTTHQVAERLGIPHRSVLRYRHNGLTRDAADRLAVRLGHHPAELWPAWTSGVAA